MGNSVWDNVVQIPVVNPSGNILRQNFTATAGQTTFVLTLFSYTVGGNAISVYKNGLYQQAFTEVASTIVTLLPCALNDVITIVGQVSITGTVTVVSDGSITVPKLSSSFILPVEQGGTNSNTAVGARVALGVAEIGINTTITSLSSPALNAATATTQLGSDSTTKVATTAQVQAAIINSSNQLEALIPSIAANALTLNWGGGTRQFRHPTLSNGSIVPTALTSASLVIPNGATLGLQAAGTCASATMAGAATLTLNAALTITVQKNAVVFQAGTRIGKVTALNSYVGGLGTGTLTLDATATFTAQPIVIINPSGVFVGITDTNIMFVSTQAGGLNLDESDLLSGTAISAGSTSTGVVYGSSAFTNRPYHILNYIVLANPTVGAYSMLPEKVQGASGSSSRLSRTGQNPINVTAQRVIDLGYRNLEEGPIGLTVNGQANLNGSGAIQINGVQVTNTTASVATPGVVSCMYQVIPAGASYTIINSSNAYVINSVFETKL